MLSFNQVSRTGQVSHIIRKRVLSAKISKKLHTQFPNLKKILMEMIVITVKGNQAIRVVVKIEKVDQVAKVDQVGLVKIDREVEEGFKKRVSNLTLANLIHR